MSNSPLVSYTKISPNRNTPRNHRIDTISIHCTAGQCSAESLGSIFASSARRASSNYGIGSDGRIGMYCEEKDRSWCTSSPSNDNRAITIEVSSDATHPYKVTSAAYKSLINLLVDICKRNPGICTLKWRGDKSLIGQVDKQNMTVHRWFANKACPGDYLYNLHGQIAKEVNARLGAKVETPPVVNKNDDDSFRVKVDIDNLNIRTGPGVGYKKTGKYTGRGVFTIVEIQNGSGSKTGWGLLSSYAKKRNGWISLDYAKKI